MVDFKEHDRMSKELASKKPKMFVVYRGVQLVSHYKGFIEAESRVEAERLVYDGQCIDEEFICSEEDLCYVEVEEYTPDADNQGE